MSRKVISIGKEYQDEEQQESIEWIKTSLDSLDEGIEIETPNIEWFEQMVAVQKEAAKKKLYKEVMIFISIALVIISCLLIILYQLPVIFLALQVIATIFVVGYSAKSYVKQVNEG